MKKLAVALALSAALGCTAGAANVGTIDNGYPGDTEAQAQMLCDLGLFRGTDQGFELEKPMTRAEAAVMLTRLLGAEDEALAGTPTHPFYDVPAWANPYVGWLYENGLTKGVSATQYGARQNVTCGQYCIFLSRAASEGASDEAWGGTLDQAAIHACDEAGFVRGDAVSISANALDWSYWQDDYGISVAQHLIDRGAFTKEQFKDAAWDVLPRFYLRTGESGSNDTELKLCCTIAGVRVLVDPDSTVTPLGLENPSYGYDMEVGQSHTVRLYRIDEKTLEQTELIVLHGLENGFTEIIARLGDTDYVQMGDAVVGVRGNKTELIVRGVSRTMIMRNAYGQYLFLNTQENTYVLGENGTFITPNGELFLLQEQNFLLTQNLTSSPKTITAWTVQGRKIGSVTVQDWQMDAEAPAAALFAAYGDLVWGRAGLYRLTEKWFERLTDRPVYGWAQDETDNSYVLITHDAGKRVEYTEYAVPMQTGDTLVRLHADGTETPLLPPLPEGSLLLGEVRGAVNGKVIFTTLKAAEPHLMSRFTCVLEDSRIRVTEADAGITMIYGENAVAEEQARLDALGVGVGAA